MRNLIPLFALATIAAPASAAIPTGPLPDEARAAVMQSINDKLRDSETARWRWPDVPETSGLTYCGWLNAKNAYGAYTGYRPYAVILDKGAKGWFSRLVSLAEREAVEVIVRSQCAAKGYDMSGPPPE